MASEQKLLNWTLSMESFVSVIELWKAWLFWLVYFIFYNFNKRDNRKLNKTNTKEFIKLSGSRLLSMIRCTAETQVMNKLIKHCNFSFKSFFY